MGPDGHLDALLDQGSQLAAMPADALDARVPSLPGWTLEEVIRHTGKVHRWVTAILQEGPGADLAAVSSRIVSLPHGPPCRAAYAEALAEVHRALGALDPDEPAASFIGPGTAGFWQRRQAHEVTVHRVDAADAVHAAGGPPPSPVPVDLARDGIDEWASVFLATRWNQRFGDFPAQLSGRRVAIVSRDRGLGDVGLCLAFDHGTVSVGPTSTPADVTLSGGAEQLLLALWRRRPLSSVTVVGDVAIAERLHEIATF